MGPLRFLVVVLATALLACASPSPALDATVPVDALVTSSDASVDAPADVLAATSSCPADWVPYARGGCGPAVLLCAPGGGADPAACIGRDLVTPRAVTDPDGVVGTAFYALPGGGIGGAWSLPRACPAGWTRDADNACIPSLGDHCPYGTSPLPDGTCTATDDTRCPDTVFAQVPPEAAGARVVYVREGATGVVNGTPENPYDSVLEVFQNNAATDVWVMLAAGRYGLEPGALASVHFVGVCADRVEVTTRAFDLARLMEPVPAPGALLDLRDVKIAQTFNPLWLEGGATVLLTRVTVDRPYGQAISLAGRSHAVLTDVTITSVGMATLVLPRTLSVTGGSDAVVRNSVFDGVDGQAVWIDGAGARVTVENSVLAHAGHELVHVAGGGGSFVMHGSVAHGGRGWGVIAEGANSSIALDSSVVSDIEPPGNDAQSPDDGQVGGVTVRSGASVVVTHALLERMRVTALHVNDATTRAILTDSVVRDTHSASAIGYDSGLGVLCEAGSVTVRGTLFESTNDAAVAGFWGAQVDVRDSRIHTVRPQAAGILGMGFVQELFGHLVARRVLVEDTGWGAIGVVSIPQSIIREFDLAQYGPPDVPLTTVGDLTDVIVARTHPRQGVPAFGIGALGGAALHAERVAVVDVNGAAVFATPDGLSTSWVINLLRTNANITDDQRDTFVRLIGPTLAGPSVLTASNLFVRAVTPWPVGIDFTMLDRPPGAPVSYGVFAGTGCPVTIDRFVLDGLDRGMYGAAVLGGLTLSHGTVTHHTRCAIARSSTALGASVQLDSVNSYANADDGTCAGDGLETVRLPFGTE